MPQIVFHIRTSRILQKLEVIFSVGEYLQQYHMGNLKFMMKYWLMNGAMHGLFCYLQNLFLKHMQVP